MNKILIADNVSNAVSEVFDKHNILYVKCGIILSDLIDEKNSQRNLFSEDTKKDNNLIFIIDKINNLLVKLICNYGYEDRAFNYRIIHVRCTS